MTVPIKQPHTARDRAIDEIIAAAPPLEPIPITPQQPGQLRADIADAALREYDRGQDVTNDARGLAVADRLRRERLDVVAACLRTLREVDQRLQVRKIDPELAGQASGPDLRAIVDPSGRIGRFFADCGL